jgi:hypothetical protein
MRSVHADGRFRVTQEAGSPQQAGWRSERGWELISPDGARQDLELTLLDRARRAAGAGHRACPPNPEVGLLRPVAVPAGGGEPSADLWQTHESRSLRASEYWHERHLAE